MGKSGRARANDARADIAVDPKRFREDATQKSAAQSFLDTPDDPYFFSFDSERENPDSAPLRATAAQRRPKSAPQVQTEATSPEGPPGRPSRAAQALEREQPVASDAGRVRTRAGKRPSSSDTAGRSNKEVMAVQKDRGAAKVQPARSRQGKKAGASQLAGPSNSGGAELREAAPGVGSSPHVNESDDSLPTGNALNESDDSLPTGNAHLMAGNSLTGAPAGGASQDNRAVGRSRDSQKGGPAPCMQPVHRPSRLARSTLPGDPELEDTPGPSTPHDLAPQPSATGAVRSGAKLATDLSTPQDGLRTPLLMRNALSAGLSRILSGNVFKTPTPAVTIMEAQESGEQMEVQDSMLYALDGLCGASAATRRQSAVSLAELCTTRRGRQAFRADGVIQEAVAAAVRLLSGSWESELAHAFAVILLSFARDAANQAALACQECLQLLRILLRSWTKEAGQGSDLEGRGSMGACAQRALQEGGHGKRVPAWLGASPAALALLAVASATDPQHPSAASESIKAGLRTHGVLETLAKYVTRSHSAELSAERSLWFLHTTLTSLENCSFACPENEEFLVGLMTAGPEGKSVGLATALVGIADAIVASQARAAANDANGTELSDCLHCALSVLMNMTHHNDHGCKQVRDAGGMEVTAKLLAGILHGAERQQLLDKLDTISVSMGLLINMAENQPDDVQRLVDVELPGSSRFLPLLCRLMEDFAPAEAGNPGGSPQDEFTAEELARHEEEGKAAILQVYSALLIGFLVARGAGAQAEVRASLAGGSLETVAAGVQRCLLFYLDAGAITDKTERSLRDLLALLAPVGPDNA